MAAPLAASWHTVSPCNKKHTSLSSMTISATFGRFRCLLLKSLLVQACPIGTMSTIGSLCESILADDNISTLFRLIVILQRTCENDGCVASSTANSNQ